MLGAYIIAGFVVFAIARIFILKLYVDRAALIVQAKKQFLTEYGLVLAIGVFVVLLNRFLAHVPLVNGVVFFIGFISFGFFIAIDMSLEKERNVIESAMKNSHHIMVSQQFYPLTRKFFIVAVATNLMVMVIVMLVVGRDLAWLASVDPSSINLMIGQITRTIFKEILFIVAVLLILVINILYSYSKNLKLLFQTETGVLEQVTNGDLSHLVPVATNDEFGVIASNTNQMIHGLRDRIRMLTRLNMAKEVQETLLPNTAPLMDHLDISGKILYCEEVGGDYFDYFHLAPDTIGIAVTDSSGHGVGAGLHMTTIRAFFRYGVENYQGPVHLLSSVNRHLTRDSYETGRFTTVFFVQIDLPAQTITWVRAGHEPALFYSPGSGKTDRLLGRGMAMGVDPDMPIHPHEINGWETGSILAIYSDGLKEVKNADGDMYGESRIAAVITEFAAASAQTIQEKMIADVNQFRQTMPIEDDITIVIVKLL